MANAPTATAAPSTTLAKSNEAPLAKPPNPITTMASVIERRKDTFARLLPKHMTVERFTKVVHAALTKTPKLANCSQTSVLMALVACSELGLEPNTPQQHAHLIPYGSECTLVVGYRGYIELAWRSGRISSISVQAAYVNDFFEYEEGDTAYIRHRPLLVGDRGDFKAAYCITRFKDGGISREVMRLSEIEEIRDRSQNAKSAKKYGKETPWDTDFGEMAKKTVIRRAAKKWPQSPELMAAIAHDDRVERGEPAHVDFDVVAEAAPPTASAKGAGAKLRAEMGMGAPPEATLEPIAPADEAPDSESAPAGEG